MTDEKIAITKQSKDKILALAKTLLAKGHIKDSIITVLSPIAEEKDLEEVLIELFTKPTAQPSKSRLLRTELQLSRPLAKRNK